MNDDTIEATASPPTSRHISVWIDAPAGAVYALARDPEQLTRWAAGLGDPALAATAVEFVPGNEFGILDHVVRLPSGEEFYNPMRVIPAEPGATCCEVVFTLRRSAGVTADRFEADAAAVAADLATLRALVDASG